MELGRCGGGVGRVFMRYFGACGSLIQCRYSGLLRGYTREVVLSVFKGHRSLCSPFFPLKQLSPASS
jgi:hypothetical protein